jgi:hypothetical protein
VTLGALNIALSGLQQYQRRAETAAGDVVRSTLAEAGSSAEDLLDAEVRLMTARRGFEACLAVARASDEMLGTVIDTLA